MFDLSDVYNGDRDNQFYAPITATVINDEFAFFIARRYASAVLLWPCVTVCHNSEVGVLLKQLN